MTAATAATTATEFAAERRKLADRVERATSWAALRESLDALTPTLRSTRGRVVRHTRAPKAAPAERPAPAPKAEPKPAPVKPIAPAPPKVETKAPERPAATVPPKASPKNAEPAKAAHARCPGTLPLIVAALIASWWMSAGETCRTARRVLRWRWREASRPYLWAIQDFAEWAAHTRTGQAVTGSWATIRRLTARVVSALRRRP